MRRGTKSPLGLKIWQKMLLLAFGLGFIIGEMAVFESLPWLFFVLAGGGALLAFVALNGGRDLNHRRSIDSGSRNSATEPKVRKDIPFNPWDGVSDNKKRLKNDSGKTLPLSFLSSPRRILHIL